MLNRHSQDVSQVSVKVSALNNLFAQPYYPIADRYCTGLLRRVARLDLCRRMPVRAITLNEGIDRRNVKIKNVLASNVKLTLNCQPRALDQFSRSPLDRTLSGEPSIALKRTESPSNLGLRCDQSKRVSARLAIPCNARFIRARDRAVGVAVSIRPRHAEFNAALRTALGDPETATRIGTVSALTSSTRIGKRLAASFTGQRRLSFLRPHSPCGAWATERAVKHSRVLASRLFRSARRAQDDRSRVRLLGVSFSIARTLPLLHARARATTRTFSDFFCEPLFAAIRAGVNVLSSHGVNLRHRLAFWSGPFRVFQHLGGPLILSQAAH